MKKLILVAALCASGVGYSQPPKSPAAKPAVAARHPDRAALLERMGQLQLAMLVDQVLKEDAPDLAKRRASREQSARLASPGQL